MKQLLLIIGISWIAGFVAFIGSTIPHFFIADIKAQEEFIYSIVALGGGILLAGLTFKSSCFCE